MLATHNPSHRHLKTGDTFYIQDWHRPLSLPTFGASFATRVHPWEIVSFHFDIQACTGQPRRFCDSATVRSLRDGRTKRVALWILRQCEEIGLERLY